MTRIKELRQRCKETQENLAILIGITRGAYANIENGKREPDIKTIFTLADHFNVTVDYLLGRDEKNAKEGGAMEIGQRIKLLREKRNLSQIELASILKIRNSTLSQYETGARTPSDDVKIAIADCFAVSVDYLLGRTDEKEVPTPVSGDGQLSPARQALLNEVYGMDEETSAATLEIIHSVKRLRGGQLAPPRPQSETESP